MSVISNTPIVQNPLAKKAFSKISFEAGEKFNARIVSTDDQKGEVNLKLLDGWQFSAKLDKPLEQRADGNVLNFEVEGFEDGKLKIKLVYGDKENKTIGNDILEDPSNGKSLSSDKTDALIFEKMIKHDMPLTKENIIDIKNIVDFKEKISTNADKEDIFIAKYLDSRNIDPNSEKATEITKVLKNFFSALKNLDVDEILLFKENNIELTKGNVESFIKLFKGDSTVYNNLKEISNYLLNSELSNDTKAGANPSSIKQNQSALIRMGESNATINPEDFVVEGDYKHEAIVDSKLGNSTKDIKSDKLIDINFKEIESDNLLDNNTKETKLVKVIENSGQIVDKTQNLNSTYNDNISNKVSVNNKTNVNNKLVDLNSFNEVVNLINKEFKNLNIDHKVLNSNIESLMQDESLVQEKSPKQDDNIVASKTLGPVKDLELSKNLRVGENLSEDFEVNSSPIKTLVDKIIKLEKISLSPDNYIELVGNLEEKLNTTQIKSSSKGLEIVNQNDELPLNKSSQNNFSKLDIDNKSALNTKVSGYGKNNSLNEIINMIKKELNLSEIDKGIINNVEKEIEKTTTDVLIKEQIKLKTGDIKNIVKDIIENKLNIKPETFEKVMDAFNQKLNDIKLFNTISQQYYYLDLPINIKESEYQFKLIIKDDRQKGKKIDSKNVKIATSVKTINMGIVDAYIKINNNNMNIDINCNEFWVKALDSSKEKLINDLSSLNYRVNIKVNNKTNDFTLENCGEFFNDRSFNTINIKV